MHFICSLLLPTIHIFEDQQYTLWGCFYIESNILYNASCVKSGVAVNLKEYSVILIMLFYDMNHKI